MASLTRSVLPSIRKANIINRISSIQPHYSTSVDDPTDPITHTGQQFDKDDYRLARFVDKKKTINTKFAIDLINNIPPESKKDRVVWCDGGSGPEGHPKVYINLDKPGNHTCGYCGLRFKKEDHH